MTCDQNKLTISEITLNNTTSIRACSCDFVDRLCLRASVVSLG